jgi:hypothetical protein
MKITIEYFKWKDNLPAITSFEGTIEELEFLKDFIVLEKIINQK